MYPTTVCLIISSFLSYVSLCAPLVFCWIIMCVLSAFMSTSPILHVPVIFPLWILNFWLILVFWIWACALAGFLCWLGLSSHFWHLPGLWVLLLVFTKYLKTINPVCWSTFELENLFSVFPSIRLYTCLFIMQILMMIWWEWAEISNYEVYKNNIGWGHHCRYNSRQVGVL